MSDFDDFFEEGFEDGIAEGGAEPILDEDSLGAESIEAGERGGDEGGQSDEGEMSQAPQFPEVQMREQIDAQAQKRIDEFVAQQFGAVVNPFTGRNITNEAELRHYQEHFSKQEQERKLKESGLDKEMLNQMIAEHPIVKQAQEMVRAKETAETENFSRSEFDSLKKAYPDCGFTSIQDLQNTAEGMQALQLWAKTGSLTQAYRAIFADTIVQRRIAATKQGVLNDVASKGHIGQARGATGEEFTLSKEEMSHWKGFFPNASESEIIAMAKKNI